MLCVSEGKEGNEDYVDLPGQQGCSCSSSTNSINSLGLHRLPVLSGELSVTMPHFDDTNTCDM